MNFQVFIELLLNNWQIILLFFTIAILYASVGFGGGSSYLAVLALTTMAFSQIRATALLCNIVVVTSGTFMYAKHGYYNWKKVAPLVLFSIPMAYLGGYLKISQHFFFLLLGITLLVAAISMWFSKIISEMHIKSTSKTTFLKDGAFGGIIGFISGMVGIGGGIFLAPLLHLTKWDTPKKIAATASFFILVNSIAGLLGQYQNIHFTIQRNLTIVLLFTVFIGGQIGSRLSNQKLPPFFIKKMTAVLIALVGLKILLKYVN